MTEEETGTYKRGHAAGQETGAILERLKQHDRHFERINGSIEKHADATNRMVAEIGRLNSNIQKLDLQAISDAATRIATAKALKDQNEERREKSEQSWSPMARILAVLTVAALIISTVISALLIIGN